MSWIRSFYRFTLAVIEDLGQRLAVFGRGKRRRALGLRLVAFIASRRGKKGYADRLRNIRP